MAEIEYELIRVVDLDEEETAIEDDDCFLVDSERYDLEVPKYINFQSIKKAIFRCGGGIALTAGLNTVTYSSAFTASCKIFTELVSGDVKLFGVISNQTAAGFDITVDIDCTLTSYFAIVNL